MEKKREIFYKIIYNKRPVKKKTINYKKLKIKKLQNKPPQIKKITYQGVVIVPIREILERRRLWKFFGK